MIFTTYIPGWFTTDGGVVYAAVFSGAGSGTIDDPYQVGTADQLNEIRNDLGAHYIQTADIDLNAYQGANSWIPIGNYDSGFYGSFNGRQYKITNLVISKPSGNAVGLFGFINVGGQLSNVILEGVSVTGLTAVGSLVGDSLGSIKNSSATGLVKGGYYVGGLVGWLRGPISNSYSRASVIGDNMGVGGLFGVVTDAKISYSYAAGNVTGPVYDTGGLVGFDINGEYISSYYDKETTNKNDIGYGVGKSTAEMKSINTFAGWDFDKIWSISQSDNDAYPYLNVRPPTAEVSSSAGGTVNAPFPVSITFSEAIQGFMENDFVIENGTVSNLVTVTSTTYSATVNPTTSGQAVKVTVAAGAITDAMGIPNLQSNTLQVQYDTTKPVATFGNFTHGQRFNVPPAAVTVSVYEAVYWIDGGSKLNTVNALPLISMKKDGAGFTAYTASFDELAHVFTLNFNGTLQDGEYEVGVAGNAVRNVYHNILEAARASFIVDQTPPDEPVLTTPTTGSGSLQLSSNADLKQLTVKAGGDELALTPVFAAGTTSYRVETSADEVSIEAVSSDAKATVILGEATLALGKTVALTEGDNVFELIVKAENGTVKSYILTIQRQTEIAPLPVESPACAFRDIKGHWAEQHICEALEKGIVKGNSETEFHPQGLVTRVEFATMLIRTLGVTPGPAADKLIFTDQDQIPAWATTMVSDAVEIGILQGYPDGSLRPMQTVSRSEMAAMIARAMKWDIDQGQMTAFADDADIPSWAKGYINATAQRGLLNGREGNQFSPSEPATRAEAAVILLRL